MEKVFNENMELMDEVYKMLEIILMVKSVIIKVVDTHPAASILNDIDLNVAIKHKCKIIIETIQRRQTRLEGGYTTTKLEFLTSRQ